MRTLPASITISRPQGPDPEEIRIVVQCETSRSRAVEVTISPGDLARALTGLAHVGCSMEFNDSGLIGMRAENKEENILLFPGDRPTKENEDQYVGPFETDGWRRRKGDWTNHHRHGSGHVSVVFFRHVDASGKGIER